MTEAKDPNARCRAHNRQGTQCGRSSLPGATVCSLHGAGAPQVKRSAALRLLELVDPAIATLAREMVSADRSADRQRAANSILDRAGVPRHIESADTDAAKALLIERLIALRDSQEPAPEPETIIGEVIPMRRASEPDADTTPDRVPAPPVPET